MLSRILTQTMRFNNNESSVIIHEQERVDSCTEAFHFRNIYIYIYIYSYVVPKS